MLRTVAAVLAGLVAAIAVITLVEAVGHSIYPPPPGIDPMAPDGMAAIVAQMPPAALVFVLFALVCGGLAGGAVSARIASARGLTEALVVGALLTIASLLNVFSVPHPIWMGALSVAIPLPAAWLGARLITRRRGSESVGR